MRSLVLVLLLISQATVMVVASEAKSNADGFLIEPSKPYVYLKFDHVESDDNGELRTVPRSQE